MPAEKLERTVASLALDSGERIDIKAVAVWPFVVHRTVQRQPDGSVKATGPVWTVTHAETGLRLPILRRKRIEAMGVASWLANQPDAGAFDEWGRVGPGPRARLVSVVRDAARYNPRTR